jgi:hypothetical protein
MNILKTLIGFATGGTSTTLETVWDAVKDALPDSEAKVQARAQLEEILRAREKDQLDSAISLAENLNQRIAAYEGTASDLKAMPYVGPLLLVARGAQRPVWGYATIWLDYQVYSGAWVIRQDQPELTAAFYIINFLVLGFLFGERALVNLLPVIESLLTTMRQKRV